MSWPLNQLVPWQSTPRRQLVVCLGGDWWDFVYNIQDDACPAHGWRQSRTPPRGADVEGPCTRCGRAFRLRAYDPDSHGATELICESCR